MKFSSFRHTNTLPPMGSVLIKMAGIPSNSSRILERLGWNKKKNLSSALQACSVVKSTQSSRFY